MKNYYFKTIDDLNNLVKANQARLQSYNFDLIVGLPRRGMIPATLIGLFLNKPVISFNELVADLASEKIGYRLKSESNRHPKSYENILLVDDSTNNGSAFLGAKNKLDIETWNKITTMSVYSTKKGANYIDLALEILDSEDKLYEWNILHKRVALKVSSMRFEGIIATNSLNGIWELITAPSYPINTIVSSLREKNRKEIENFLKENNVEYENLIMEVVSSKQLKEIVFKNQISLHFENDPFITHDLNDVVSVYNVASNVLTNPVAKETLDYDTSN
ncbi:MAG: phosphoribosyltransferase [Lactobacillaceae bacterium]|jgi:hypoxanthine phosphoribosyltransferase|nr:phosphoribosyltransferase [Lactobacillaceae bacterium]